MKKPSTQQLYIQNAIIVKAIHRIYFHVQRKWIAQQSPTFHTLERCGLTILYDSKPIEISIYFTKG